MKKALFIVLAAALMLAGCKGGDGSSTAPSSGSSAAEQSVESAADSVSDKNGGASEADVPDNSRTDAAADPEDDIPSKAEDVSSTELDILPIDNGQGTASAAPDAPAPSEDKGTTAAPGQTDSAQPDTDQKPAAAKQTDKAPASADADTQSKTQSVTKPASESKREEPAVTEAPKNSEYELPIVPVV